MLDARLYELQRGWPGSLVFAVRRVRESVLAVKTTINVSVACIPVIRPADALAASPHETRRYISLGSTPATSAATRSNASCCSGIAVGVMARLTSVRSASVRISHCRRAEGVSSQMPPRWAILGAGGELHARGLTPPVATLKASLLPAPAAAPGVTPRVRIGCGMSTRYEAGATFETKYGPVRPRMVKTVSRTGSEKTPRYLWNTGNIEVGSGGIEPPTQGFSGPRSTD